MLREDERFNGKKVNLVGHSQGNIVARGILQKCDAVEVVNYISVAGPQMGTDIVPQCLDGWKCGLLNTVVRDIIYSPVIQSFVAPAK